MTYRIRKEWFKDYMWQQTGTWAYYNTGAGYTQGGLVFADPGGLGHAYDLRQMWRDVRWPGGVAISPWHDAPLLSSTKFYSLYNHEYTTAPTVGGTKHKNGLFCISGMEANADTSIADTSGTMRLAGGIPAAGFSGQYGKAFALNYTGTMHEAALAFHTGYATVDQEGNYTFTEPEDRPGYNPNSISYQFPPLAISLYGSRDSPLTALDGIHAIIVPPGTDYWIFNAAGVLTLFQGGVTGLIIIAVGDISQPYMAGFLTYVTHFTAYDNLDPLDIVRNKEFFIRLIYYPESKPIKRYNVPNPNDPNLDRRLLVYFGTDKKRLKFVGKSILVDYDYTTPKNYMFVVCYNNGWNGQGTSPYFPTLHQFDEVVCGGEWLPYEQGEAFCSHTQFPNLIKLGYTKESNELTYDAASTTDNIPTWQIGDICEVWNYGQNWGIRNRLLYGSDFAVAFPDVWTVVTTTGTAWRHSLTPWPLALAAPFEDLFNEIYTNKNNDRDWTVTAGTWDTTTTPGSLHGTGAGGIISLDTIDISSRDYAIAHELTIDSDTGTVYDYFGTQAGAVVNTSIRVTLNAGAASTIDVDERVGGAWVNRADISGVYSGSVDILGSNTWKFVRMGALFKIYLNGSLLYVAALATVQHTQHEYMIELNGSTIDMGYINLNFVLPNSYGYMYNIGLATDVEGSIHYHQAVNGIMGYCDMTFWEDWEYNAGSSGEVWVRIHYDNGAAGTNYIGVKVAWDGASKTLTLYDAAANAHAVTLPTDPEIVNGYTQHSYKLYWAASGGLITQVALYNAVDNSLLHMVDGLAHAYGANVMVESYTKVANPNESAYLGQIVMWECPEPTNDLVEVPVCDAILKEIIPADDKGLYVLIFRGMDYPLYQQSEYDTGTSHHQSEVNVTFSDLLTEWLLENGSSYWRWFHYWNYKVTDVPLGWIPFRMRGFNVHQVFERMAQWAGMRFMCTPEQQFVFQKYYRNFDIDTGQPYADPLELDNPDPQGIYWSSNTITAFNNSQKNWLTGFTRADDAQIGHRVGSVNTEGADFIDPLANTAGLNQQIYDSIGAAHANPTMTARPLVNVVGNVTTNEGGSAPDMLNPTLGSVNTPTDAQTTTWLTQQANSYLSTYSHKNEAFLLTMYASVPWFRPMDTIHVEVSALDPSIQALSSGTILRMYRYVVQSARHIFHTNSVQYLIGRREDYLVEEVETNVVDGYGDTTTKATKLMKLAETANEANSNSCQ